MRSMSWRIPWTRGLTVGQRLSIPAKHTTGRYWAEDLPAEQVVLRYAPGHNFNGSMDDIAGVCNEAGNVLGLMPHPEHAVDPLLGPTGGIPLLEGLIAAARDRLPADALTRA